MATTTKVQTTKLVNDRSSCNDWKNKRQYDWHKHHLGSWDLERDRRQETGEKWKHTDMSWLLTSNNSVLLDEHSILDQHLLLRLAEIWSLNFFFLYTFCKIKSPRFFCCCWFWVSILLLYLNKLIILPNIITPYSLWISITQFLPVKIFH